MFPLVDNSKTSNSKSISEFYMYTQASSVVVL